MITGEPATGGRAAESKPMIMQIWGVSGAWNSDGSC
jgi:hypothetical protein